MAFKDKNGQKIIVQVNKRNANAVRRYGLKKFNHPSRRYRFSIVTIYDSEGVINPVELFANYAYLCENIFYATDGSAELYEGEAKNIDPRLDDESDGGETFLEDGLGEENLSEEDETDNEPCDNSLDDDSDLLSQSIFNNCD